MPQCVQVLDGPVYFITSITPPAPAETYHNDGAALTTPLSVTGTPKELDEQLPRQLEEFVEIHLELSSTLKSAKEQMEAAAKAAREAARKSATSTSHGGSSKSATQSSMRAPNEAGAKEGPDDLQPNRELAAAAAESETLARAPETCSILNRRIASEGYAIFFAAL
jgi:PRTRC genetic system protein E